MKEFLPSILMAVISIILVIYALIPGIKYIQKTWTEIETLTKENGVLKKKINTLSQFDEETLSAYMTTLLSAVPSDKSIASILMTIDSVAMKNNVALADLKVMNPGSISSDSASMKISNTKLGSNTIRIATSIKGTPENVFSFVSNIRKVRRLIRIATLSQTFQSSEASPSATTSLELEAFFAPLPKTLGKIESEIQPLSANEEQMITTMSEYPLEFESMGQGGQGQVESGNKIDPFSF